MLHCSVALGAAGIPGLRGCAVFENSAVRDRLVAPRFEPLAGDGAGPRSGRRRARGLNRPVESCRPHVYAAASRYGFGHIAET